MNIEQYISKVPDFPKKGILFYDLSPLMASPKAWQYTVDKICDIVSSLKPDLLAGIESRGFLISSAIATKMKIGFVLIRKKGKTPGEVVSHTYKLEYGEDTLEINKKVTSPNKKVLILDDVLATGGTINASVELIEKVKCEAIGAVCILELASLKGREKIKVPAYSLLTF